MRGRAERKGGGICKCAALPEQKTQRAALANEDSEVAPSAHRPFSLRRRMAAFPGSDARPNAGAGHRGRRRGNAGEAAGRSRRAQPMRYLTGAMPAVRSGAGWKEKATMPTAAITTDRSWVRPELRRFGILPCCGRAAACFRSPCRRLRRRCRRFCQTMLDCSSGVTASCVRGHREQRRRLRRAVVRTIGEHLGVGKYSDIGGLGVDYQGQ